MVMYLGLQNSLRRSVKGINNVKVLSKYIKRLNHDSKRFNFVNIQMLSESLHQQVFKTCLNDKNIEEENLLKTQAHLECHDLWGKQSSVNENIVLDLPKLHGENLIEHFQNIAHEENKHYFAYAESLANTLNKFPPVPNKWKFQQGWTKYFSDGTSESVAYPDEDALVFDVEICLSFGMVPVLATALSKNAWYCWISEYLTDDKIHSPENITPNHMIPINSENKEKLLIGHHVAFDRAFVKEEYNIKKSSIGFLDTLSLHVCVSGVTNEQRNYMNSKNPAVIYDWMQHGSTNSLVDVYEFYCGKTVEKSTRDLFVHGTMEDIRENFQECVRYCATDVLATHEVFQNLWPQFQRHAPHPVTFSGMIEMGSAYLPIDDSWRKYLQDAEDLYTKISQEMKNSLMNAAVDTLEMMIDKRYKKDPWLWNLDWSLHKTVEKSIEADADFINTADTIEKYIDNSIANLSEKRRNNLILPGYPKWYRDLCECSKTSYSTSPTKISSQTKVTPLLLRMTWDGYPLHYERKYGWGYLIPTKEEITDVERWTTDFPYEEFLQIVQQRNITSEKSKDSKTVDLIQEIYHHNNDDAIKNGSKSNGKDIGIPGVLFYQLPHKNGENFNVGNPLAKDFLEKIEDGTLVSNGSYNAKQPIEMNKMLAFWRNGRKRITSQLTVWLENDKDHSTTTQGVILPQVITAGTVTRRAVEPTWLTASNPLPDRIGSELKSLVRPPPGYCLVGADVDSQELWIASLFGDAQFSRIHGSTALSWMTLQGKKSEGTDLHSRTAQTIGTNRDQAKIFNYGRVYGAGQKFAYRLLRQFNHQLSEKEAEERAAKLYKATKGVKKFKLTTKGKSLCQEIDLDISDDYITFDDLKKMMSLSQTSWDDRLLLVEPYMMWDGGSESEMFNMLEGVALATEPRTPILECSITNALLPKHVHKYYKTSRVNWVVQSSAVDYLHLLLTSMRWLIRHYHIDARFCISIHDEVRYIVHEKDKYRAALALQISNLFTRAIFAYKMGIYDLPQSVAFFSSVDIDHVLRKEVDMDCITPSNPKGLWEGQNIPPGESLDIYDIIKKTNGGVL